MSVIFINLVIYCYFYQRSNTLFSMWNMYETRLPQSYYQEKLLNTGDFLFSVKVLHVVVQTVHCNSCFIYCFSLYTKINRKHFPCFHRVMVTRVKFGKTRNAVETWATGECFYSNFEFSQTFTSELYGNTGNTIFYQSECAYY